MDQQYAKMWASIVWHVTTADDRKWKDVPWWLRPLSNATKRASRIEGRIRRAIYQNLGAFRLDMIDAMAHGEGLPPEEQVRLRQQWLSTSIVEDVVLGSALSVARLEKHVKEWSVLIHYINQNPALVLYHLHRQITGAPDSISINGERWVHQGLMKKDAPVPPSADPTDPSAGP